MTLTVHPDPQEAAGGYAFLELPQGTLTADQAMVAVYDAFGERWLAASEAPGARVGIGNPRWQADRFEFGPYDVYRHDGADWVRIGPEIVNKIEEYAPLRIGLGGREYDLSWPDDIPPRAGAAVLGGIQPVSRPDPGSAAPVPVREQIPPPPENPPPESEPSSVPEPVPEPEPDLQASSARAGAGSRRWPYFLALLLVLIAAGAAAYWFIKVPEPVEIAEETPEVPVEESVTPIDPCSQASMSVLSTFAAVGTALQDCVGAVTADAALALVEDYAVRGDPDALLLFGKLYDDQIEDAPIETGIGLTFSPDIARSAEYYARAFAAGSGVAADLLVTACDRLESDSSTLSKGAYDDYCK